MVSIKLMDITPSIATKMLERNTRNRKLQQRVVDNYANDMRKGAWTVSDSAICLDTNGDLINGQHRLWAVVESQATIQSFVAEGYSPDSILQMDGGVARSFADSYNLKTGDTKIGTRHSAIAKILLKGPIDKTGASRADMATIMEKHYDAIVFGAEIVPARPGLRVAHVQAVMARAFYHHDRAGVEKFCKLLLTGEIIEPRDRTASLLRDYALRKLGADTRTEKYYKTEHALHSYLVGNAITRLNAANHELFSLPGERLPKR